MSIGHIVMRLLSAAFALAAVALAIYFYAWHADTAMAGLSFVACMFLSAFVTPDSSLR